MRKWNTLTKGERADLKNPWAVCPKAEVAVEKLRKAMDNNKKHKLWDACQGRYQRKPEMCSDAEFLAKLCEIRKRRRGS